MVRRASARAVEALDDAREFGRDRRSPEADGGFVRRHQGDDRQLGRVRLKRHHYALFGPGLFAVGLLRTQRQVVSA